jgi:chromosome segregation ATPase
MKNRNIPYYMAVLALAAGMSTSFVSCVDTDEPETVTKLRQEAIAKLQADADFVKAEAEAQRAKAALDNATAKVKEAQAQKKLAEAKTKELQNKLTEGSLDDKIKADIEKELARLEEQKSTYETNRLAAAKAAAEYEAAMAAKIAEEKAKLTTISDDKAVTTALETYIGKEKALATAKVDYANALIAKDKEEAQLKAELEIAKIKLQQKQDEYKKFEALFTNTDINAWATAYKEADESNKALITKKVDAETTVSEKEAAIELKETEINADYNNWAASTKRYEFPANEAVKVDIAGENNNYVADYKQQYTVKLTYANDKFSATFTPKKEYTDYDENWNVTSQYWSGTSETADIPYHQNSDWGSNGLYSNIYTPSLDPAKIVLEFALDKLKQYKNPADVKAQENILADMGKDKEGSTYYNAVKEYSGDPAVSTDKGKLGAFNDAFKAWSEATGTAKEEKVAAVRDAWEDLYGTNIPFVKGTKTYSDEVTFRAYVKDHNLTLSACGAFGAYLAAKDDYDKQDNKVKAYTAGNKMYTEIKAKYDALVALYDEKNAEKDSKLQNDADLLKMKEDLATAKTNLAAITAEITKNDAVKTATAAALDGDNGIGVVTIQDSKGVEIASYKFSAIENLTTLKTGVLAAKQKNIDVEQAEVTAAEQALENFKNGISTANGTVEAKKLAVDQAQAECDAAKDAYEKTKAAYTAEKSSK